MKAPNHLFAFIIICLFLFLLLLILVKSSSSVDATPCNPVKLNQVHEINSVLIYDPGANISGFFSAPLDYPYEKFYGFLNATLTASCSTLNYNCSYYVNNVFCGIIPTNQTTFFNTTGGIKNYPLCLKSLKHGFNFVTLSTGSSWGGASINEIFLDMELLPANC